MKYGLVSTDYKNRLCYYGTIFISSSECYGWIDIHTPNLKGCMIFDSFGSAQLFMIGSNFSNVQIMTMDQMIISQIFNS